MSPRDPIDLFQGWPAPDLLPTEHLKNAAIKALSNKAVSIPGLEYGPDEGHFPLRRNIAKWLSEFYTPSQAINPDRICITGGASQNLTSILQVFTDPHDTKIIWLVEPTYHLVFRTFEDAGFHGRLRGIPEDEEGMDANALENALRYFEDRGSSQMPLTCYASKPRKSYRKIYRHVIYCVPSFANPSGTIMTSSRRKALVRLARKYDALIICDDVYDFLCWDMNSGTVSNGKDLQRLVDIDRTLEGAVDSFGNVVSNGSFSKLIGPGCRVGWAEGTKDFTFGLSHAGQTKSGGAPSQLMSTFINELLESNVLQRHITELLIPEGHQRYASITSAIKEHLTPLGAQFNAGAAHNTIVGGYYIWIKIPAPLSAAGVCQKALESQNLTLGCGDLFRVPEDNPLESDLHQRLRLSFMWEDGEKLVEGIDRLGNVLRGML
ncbi:hypothetical protein N7532_008372 [Penicillium argentinense]|uniref:Aminotransferase class I/classII large domain-containing protein n=1 Tax=Penicillium argentinense TaxID=1131581 RepID=A0A9W9EX77_9EURO|nr:uncharacterized protein N7532_008372 [Penicillium argentinense]KAJ5089688.1 hypothetical protein N7532_008372 [Penicillium argentinense]